MDEKIRLRIARRITLLYLIEIGDKENLPLVAPLNHREDLDALIKRDLIERDSLGEVKLTLKGRKLMKNIPQEQKKRYRRFFFSH